MTALSVSAIQDYATQLKPLFNDPTQLDLIRAGMDTIHNLSAILIGRDSDTLSHSDMENLIQKLSDLYIVWVSEGSKKSNLPNLIGQSLDVLLRPPYTPYSISMNQITSTLNNIQKVVQVLQPDNKVDWDLYRSQIRSGFKIKNLLYGKADNTLYSAQLKELQKDLEPFRNSDDSVENFTALANLLKTNLFAEEIDLNQFLDEVDVFLPANQKIESFGFSKEQIGLLKAIIFGGNAQKITKDEFSEMARIAASVSKFVIPVSKTLPQGFVLGMNSPTAALAEAGLQALIEAKSEPMKTADLEKFLFLSFQKAKLPVTHATLKILLTGLNQRVLTASLNPNAIKGPKETQFPATLPTQGFKALVQLLEGAKLSFADLEQTFSGLDRSTPYPQSFLLNRFSRPETKRYLTSLQPLFDAKSGTPHLEARGKKGDGYSFDDLTYKVLLYRVLEWAFPFYEIESDPDATAPRLTFNDTTDLLTDLNDLIYELGLSFTRGTPEESAKKRMQTINLFTQAGNGDDYVDVDETVEFFTLSFGGKVLLKNVRNDLGVACYPEVKDPQTILRFSYPCITKSFFSNDFMTKNYSGVVPQTVEEYVGLNADDRETFRTATLTAASSKWTETGSMILDDLETLVSIPYYVENIFERMDTNFNGNIEFSEAMKVFPVFCKAIKDAGGSQVHGECGPGLDPNEVEAIYGYLMYFGAPPDVSGGFFSKVFKGIKFKTWAKHWRKSYRYTSD